ncbi:MAG: radical SAM protein [Candidatus Moraniibacteriota bacterium]
MEVSLSPKFVVLEITRRCNLNCKHCYINANNGKYDELSFDEIKNLVDELSEMKVFVFGLVGGEPFLREDIFEILSYAKNKGLATTLSTNGILITKIIAKKLKEVEISEVSVSLDGLEDFHDKFRGRKCFDKVVNGIKELKENNIYTIVSTCVCPQNIESLDEMAKFIISLKIDSWRLFPIIPTGRAKKDLLLSLKQMQYLQEFVIKMRGLIPNVYIGESAGWCGQKDKDLKLVEWDGCRAGKEYCAISADGRLKACPTLPDEFLEESIRERSFKNLWEDKRTFEIFRKYDTNKLKGKCKKCKMKQVCEGGCRIVTLGLKNDIYDEFPLCTYNS